MSMGAGEVRHHGDLPAPTWTILVPTLGQRRELFERLLSVLLPQLDQFGGAVRVLAWWNNGVPPLPDIRQGLVRAVTTDYLSFVDDDDMVPEYFVAEVMQALASWPDYVGWRTAYYNRGQRRGTVYHSLAHGGWWRDQHGIYRDVTHINPVRAELARRADFRTARVGEPEDRAWVRQMRPHLVRQVYIDKVMYHYLYDSRVSAWRRPRKISRGPFDPTQPDSPHFSYHRPTDEP